MPNKTDKMINPDDCAGVLRADHPVDLAHYLRQATITRQRHAASLNYAWCKHRQPTGNSPLWKH